MSDTKPSDALAELLTQRAVNVLPPLVSDSRLNPAKWMHERIVRSINRFEETLDQEQEVGARLVSFGADMAFHVEDVGYWGPDMVVFYGVDAQGRRVELLQHITQLSVLLVAMPKIHDKPRRIGFEMLKGIEKDKS